MKATKKIIGYKVPKRWVCFWIEGNDTGVMSIDDAVAIKLLSSGLHSDDNSKPNQTVYNFNELIPIS